jgi:two-component system cell cycle sensor histidine kinase/response regulator CckA
MNDRVPDDCESPFGFGQGPAPEGDYVRLVVETFQHPFLILDGELKVLAANRAFYRSFQVSPQETKGRYLYDLGDGQWNIPALRTLLEKILPKDLMITGYEVEHDFPLIGSKTMKLSARRLTQGDGAEPTVLMALEDITGIKAMEKALRLSESKYRGLFQTARDGILILDPASNRIDCVNPYLAELLGYSEEELNGKELYEIGLLKDVAAGKALFEQLKAKGRIRFHHLPLQAKNGAHVDVEFICNVYGEKNKEWVQCNIRDISERKRMEETVKYGTEKLRQGQKAEATGKLAAGVAHNFNNLLTTINGYCSLCLSLVEREGPLHNYLLEICRAGEKAAALTRQIMAYSRQLVLAPKLLRLDELVAGMLPALRRLVKDNTELVFESDPSLDLVKADQGQMEQAVTNLVLNACDAMPEGGKVTVETRRVELDEQYVTLHPLVFPGVYVMLAVSDTGMGMSAWVRAHAFEPYFTTKPLSQGAGLGLSMVYGIVTQSEGHISVYSEPGQGSCIKVYLPAVSPSGRKITDATLPAASAVSGNETVLLVEDEEAVRKFAKETLEANGYKVLEASDGETALAMMEGHEGSIQLLLTDLFLPGINGRDLSQRFHLCRPEGRTLFMSGYTGEAVVQHGFLEKDARFIQNPFTAAALLGAVRETLDLVAHKPG